MPSIIHTAGIPALDFDPQPGINGDDGREDNCTGESKPVAAYVRMSTEHQRYSVANQLKAIRKYAARNQMNVVRVFADRGRSGLSLKQRAGLSELLEDVAQNTRQFEEILVYDVSRWGRFQDTDEAAYYEFLCRAAGYKIHYCTELFKNDGSPVSAILKNIKRIMAAEYSRELSIRVFAGQVNSVRNGFHWGGPAGFGLRRMLIDKDGNRKGTLPYGVRKAFHGDRVVLVPGPKREQAVIRQIFRWFVENKLSPKEIVTRLNKKGLKTDRGRPWTYETVRGVLFNEKYVGNAIFNRKSSKLKGKRVNNPQSKWIRHDGAIKPIVDPEVFCAAQRIRKERSGRLTDKEMLQRLRNLYEQHGYLTVDLINKSLTTPMSLTYRKRFGPIDNAYRLIGYPGLRNLRYTHYNREFLELHEQKLGELTRYLHKAGACLDSHEPTGGLIVNGVFSIGIAFGREIIDRRGTTFWSVSTARVNRPDFYLIVRGGYSAHRKVDYFFLPSVCFPGGRLKFFERNGLPADAFRIRNFDLLCQLAIQIPVDQFDASRMKSTKLETIPETHLREGPRLTLEQCSAASRWTRGLYHHHEMACRKIGSAIDKSDQAVAHLNELSGALATILQDNRFAALLREEGFRSIPKLVQE